MTFNNWIDTFISEKGISLSKIIEVEGDFGLNMIPVECLIEAIKAAPEQERRQIKAMIVKIDFMNGDVMDFFKHLAKAIAV